MKKKKKLINPTIKRLRKACRVLLGKPDPDLSIEIGMQRCDECFYYKQAREPAETTEAAPPNRYYHEITYLENVVLVVLYEATEDGPKELARAHGHIIHEGAEGIAQATSYAMKGIWYKVQGTK